MSEIFENDSIENGVSTPPFTNDQEEQNRKEDNKSVLLTKLRLFKETHDVYYKFFICLLILQFISVISQFAKDGLSGSHGIISSIFTFLFLLFMLVPAILLLVYFFSYISKMKSIARFSNNKILSSAATLQLTGIIGLFVLAFLFVFTLVTIIISLFSKNYNNIYNLLYNLQYQSSYLSGIVSVILIYIITIIGFSITNLVGQIKEYTGYIVEVSSIDSELVDSFKLAKTWFIVSIIVNLILGLSSTILAFITNIYSLVSDIKYFIISIVIQVLAFVALYYKFKALKHSVTILEAKINS